MFITLHAVSTKPGGIPWLVNPDLIGLVTPGTYPVTDRGDIRVSNVFIIGDADKPTVVLETPDEVRRIVQVAEDRREARRVEWSKGIAFPALDADIDVSDRG